VRMKSRLASVVLATAVLATTLFPCRRPQLPQDPKVPCTVLGYPFRLTLQEQHRPEPDVRTLPPQRRIYTRWSRAGAYPPPALPREARRLRCRPK